MELKKIEPNVDLQLSKNELEFFYKNLLFCESNKSKLTGYKFGDKDLKKFLVEKSYNVNHVEHVSKESNDNEIQFTDNKKAICVSLFVHLRNAFAHGYITKDAKTGILHFQDYYKKNCTMDGKMTFEKLNSLITNMKNTKNDENKNY